MWQHTHTGVASCGCVRWDRVLASKQLAQRTPSLPHPAPFLALHSPLLAMHPDHKAQPSGLAFRIADRELPDVDVAL
jgi:hypothetical protein